MATKPLGSGGEIPDADDSDATGRDLAAARKGCTEALGKLLDECRQYLLLVANEEIADALRPKVAPSDLVQDSFLEAQRDFHRFRGTTRSELLACCTTWRMRGATTCRPPNEVPHEKCRSATFG